MSSGSASSGHDRLSFSWRFCPASNVLAAQSILLLRLLLHFPSIRRRIQYNPCERCRCSLRAVKRGLLDLAARRTAGLAHGPRPAADARPAAAPLDRRRPGHLVRADDRPAAILREELAAEFAPLATTIDRHLSSSDGTHKLLLRLHDGQLVECVLMQEADRRTVCISTQVGCGMGCVFCASGLGGVVRNLIAGGDPRTAAARPQPAAGRRNG